MEQESNIDRFKRLASERIEAERHGDNKRGILDYSIQIIEDDPEETNVCVQLHLDTQWTFGNYFFESLRQTLGSRGWTLFMDNHQLYVKFITTLTRHRFEKKE
jgi:hypothetical protein